MQVLFIAEDRCTFDFVTKDLGAAHVYPALATVEELPDDVSGGYGSSKFNELCIRRLNYILHTLGAGVPVLFQDLDSAVLEDPFKYMPMGCVRACVRWDCCTCG